MLDIGPTIQQALAQCHELRSGQGGPKGLKAEDIALAARILAAADTYHTKTEPRSHRRALEPDAAGEEIRRQAQRGQLDGDVAQALLDPAGHQVPPELSDELPAGLSDREVEVLRLIVHGLSNPKMAQIRAATGRNDPGTPR